MASYALDKAAVQIDATGMAGWGHREDLDR
jgi:hypothetical protein